MNPTSLTDRLHAAGTSLPEAKPLRLDALRISRGPKIAPPWTHLFVNCDIEANGATAEGLSRLYDFSIVHLSGYIDNNGWLVQTILYVPGFDSAVACELVQAATGLQIRNRPIRPWSSGQWVSVEPLYLGPDVFQSGLDLCATREVEAAHRYRLHKLREALAGESQESVRSLLATIHAENMTGGAP